jgi:GNAT superfamily N-acetyltransferase
MADHAMFPLSNLDRFGLDGDHDYAPRMWISERDGQVTDVLTIGRSGMILPALPGEDWAAAARCLGGRRISGCIGPTHQVRAMLSALGLDDCPKTLDRDEPHFALDLDALHVPEGPGTLHPLEAADRDEMIRWRAAYEVEVLGADPRTGLETARADYEAYVNADSHRILLDDDRPLSTTGFNATAGQAVQIGGVYTPPPLRGRGHARRAVALHLAEVRDRGARRAILFSAGPAAEAAYRAIGFQRIGDWTLCILAQWVWLDG